MPERPVYQHQLEETVAKQRKQLQARQKREAEKRRPIARALRDKGYTISHIAWLTGVSRTQVYKDLDVSDE